MIRFCRVLCSINFVYKSSYTTHNIQALIIKLSSSSSSASASTSSSLLPILSIQWIDANITIIVIYFQLSYVSNSKYSFHLNLQEPDHGQHISQNETNLSLRHSSYYGWSGQFVNELHKKLPQIHVSHLCVFSYELFQHINNTIEQWVYYVLLWRKFMTSKWT